MTASSEPAVVTRVPTKDIRMRFRLREPKDDRVKEISESIARIGLINPLTISKDGYLITGYHRLAAIKFLGQSSPVSSYYCMALLMSLFFLFNKYSLSFYPFWFLFGLLNNPLIADDASTA